MTGPPHTLRRSWPRRIAWGAVLLLLGLVISVGVAWGCVLWIPLDMNQGLVHVRPAGMPNWIAKSPRTNRLPAIPAESEPNRIIDELTSLPDVEWRDRYASIAPLDRSLHVSSLELTGRSFETIGSFAQRAVDQRVTVYRIRAGWPRSCLHAYLYKSHPVAPPQFPDWHGVIQLPEWLTTASQSPLDNGVVPWFPLWPGLIANTLFYASILWFFTFGLSFIRRARRRAKGRCVFCNYSLTGLALGAMCPECGTISVASGRAGA